MRHFLLRLGLATLLSLFVLPAVAGPVGVTLLTASTDPDRAISITLWYPAANEGAMTRVGANAVFAGSAAAQDVPAASGIFPTVLLSHGGLRSAPDSGAWLASRLAARGYLVAEVQGPTLERPDQAPDEFWKRPADLSAALTALTEGADWHDHVDANRIVAIGVYLGGTAALALAGAQVESEVFFDICDAEQTSVDCAWFETKGVSLGSVDMGALTRSYFDPRVAAAIALEPEYTEVLAASLSTLQTPVGVIDLGTETFGAEAETATIETYFLMDTTMFDGFGTCTAKGAAILAEEGGDAALCGGALENRVRVHDELEELIVTFLADRLP